jgi:hypothetical protein
MTPTPLLIAALVLIAGCGEIAQPSVATDQCLRREVFFACMQALPKGPERIAASNDWDEVVDSCGSQAYYQSRRAPAQIKAECYAP